MKTIKLKYIVLSIVISLPYLALIPAFFWHESVMKNASNSSFVIISKQEMMLYHYNFKGQLLQKTKIATGKNYGNKKVRGDLKTPEGVFRVSQVEDASSWKHDFKDDSLGEISGAYGPYFIRLIVPGQRGIGIHGTHDPNSIGTRASEGCIRLPNQEIVKLAKRVKPNTVVVITPGLADIEAVKDIIQSKKTTKQVKKKS
ncbi:MAG: L,D-transpeptidase [Bacteroidetes bacterium]|nr:L,D-transpeptidase [Bacteroidota bacterium]